MRHPGAISRVTWRKCRCTSRSPHLHKTLQAVKEVLGAAQHPTVNEVPLLPKLLQHDAERIRLACCGQAAVRLLLHGHDTAVHAVLNNSRLGCCSCGVGEPTDGAPSQLMLICTCLLPIATAQCADHSISRAWCTPTHMYSKLRVSGKVL